MSFDFKCPYCQNLFTAEDEWVGQTTQCPNCHNQVVIQKAQQPQGGGYTLSVPRSQPISQTPETQAQPGQQQYHPGQQQFQQGQQQFQQGQQPYHPGQQQFQQGQQQYHPGQQQFQQGQQPYHPGQQQYQQAPPSQSCGAPKSASTHILLGVFLGAWGAHNFYSGRNQLGMIKAIVSGVSFLLGFFTFCVTWFVPLGMYIWGIVEICTTKTDADGVPFI